MPRFVLLEHNWNGVHWDLMLEAGEILRTWAIDEPIVSGRDLLARALGDHRKMYLEYEGEVGGDRGWVKRVEAGTYRVLEWSDDHVRVELERSSARRRGGSTKVGGGLGRERLCSWVLRAGNFD